MLDQGGFLRQNAQTLSHQARRSSMGHVGFRSLQVKGVYLINADGSGQSQLAPVEASQNGTVFPVWSPDGRRIAFADWIHLNGHDVAHQIAIVNADGTGRHDILRGATPTKSALWCPKRYFCNVNTELDWASKGD
jgi:WD40 repeat protein